MSERVVITGANRGLGLELARAYAARGDTVIAGCRHPEAAPGLRSLTRFVYPLDTGDEQSIAAFSAQVGDGAVDVLYNNAGLDARAFGAGDAERDVLSLSADRFERVMRVNAIGPMLLVRALLPMLKRSARARIVNVSSQIGSMVVSASLGRDVSYASSKAALNMITVKLAWRLRSDHIIAIALHPGHLRTAMGGATADMDAPVAVAAIVELVSGLALGQSGGFYRWDGTVHPW